MQGRACSGLQPPPPHCPWLPCCWMDGPASAQASRCRARVPSRERPTAAVAGLTPAQASSPEPASTPHAWPRLPAPPARPGCALLGGRQACVQRGHSSGRERAGPVARLSLVLRHHGEAFWVLGHIPVWLPGPVQRVTPGAEPSVHTRGPSFSPLPSGGQDRSGLSWEALLAQGPPSACPPPHMHESPWSRVLDTLHLGSSYGRAVWQPHPRCGH